jgi:hypothetical protein
MAQAFSDYPLLSALDGEAIIAGRSLALWQQAHRIASAYARLAQNGLKFKHRHKILVTPTCSTPISDCF